MFRRMRTGLLAALAFVSSAHATTTREIKPDPVQGYRYQIVTTDDSAITRRIVDDMEATITDEYCAEQLLRFVGDTA